MLLALLSGLPLGAMAGEVSSQSVPVDLQLVIAADVSLSMDPEEKRLQSAGFAAAFRDPEIVSAITEGPSGRISVAYFEWGGRRLQRMVVPWMVIDGVESAWNFASHIERARSSTLRGGTSVAAALDYAGAMLDESVSAPRRIVNLSSDGIDDRALDLDGIRKNLFAGGVTVNAMAILYKGRLHGVVEGVEDTMTPADMLAYFRDRVIGGPGAFVEPVWSVADYKDAIRRKLLREIRHPALSAGLADP